jgi:hypothetical protein
MSSTLDLSTSQRIRHANINALLISINDSSQALSIPSQEGGYFSIFFSSKQSQQISILKYLGNLATVLMIWYKLGASSTSCPWILVFSPLFFSNLLTLSMKTSEIHYLLNIREVPLLRACRQFATIFDVFASIYVKIVIVCLLSFKYDLDSTSDTLLYLSFPFWFFLILSVTCRFLNKDPQHNRTLDNEEGERSDAAPFTTSTPFLTRHRFLTWLGIVVIVLQRGIQPLLILLKLNNTMGEETHWAAVFFPLWGLIFFVLGCAVLLVSFAPYVSVNGNGNQQLKEITLVLVYLIAFQLALGAICSTVFLINLSQKLDSISSNQTRGSDTSTARIILPIIIMFAVLTAVNPIFIRFTTKYQVSSLHCIFSFRHVCF